MKKKPLRPNRADRLRSRHVAERELWVGLKKKGSYSSGCPKLDVRLVMLFGPWRDNLNINWEVYRGIN